MSKPFVPTVIVGQAIAGEASVIKNKIEVMIQTLEKSRFDIAELLFEAKTKGFYVEWGFDTFQDYAQTLKIKKRTVQYMTRIVGVMQQVGIPRSTYEPLGIARLREITSLDPDLDWTNPNTQEKTPIVDFIKGFVEQGEELPFEDLKRHVRTLKGIVGENDIQWRNIPFRRQVIETVIDPALELTRANIGSVGKDDEGISKDASEATCVEVWAVEYMNDPAHKFQALLEQEEENETE